LFGIDIDKIMKEEIIKPELKKIEKEWEEEKGNFPPDQQNFVLISKLIGFIIMFNAELIKENNNQIKNYLIEHGILNKES
jgi:hypothetical protein